MRRRIHLKRKIRLIPKNKGNCFLLFIFLFLISLFFTFRFISKKASPILMDYAEMEITKLSNIIINKAISKQLVENASIDDLFIVTKDNSGEIKTIDFNSVVVNKFLSTTTSSIQLSLKQIEEGNIDLLELPDEILIQYDEKNLKRGIIYEIPSGVIFGNSLLSNLGPKIPIKFSLLGDINSNIKTKITNYGINNALIEVSMQIKVTEKALLPFLSKKIVVENSVPISIKMIEGSIPSYYFNGIDRESTTFSLPTN